jgi:hypothetical protein
VLFILNQDNNGLNALMSFNRQGLNGVHFFGFDCGFGVWMVLFLDLGSKKLIKLIYNCYN